MIQGQNPGEDPMKWGAQIKGRSLCSLFGVCQIDENHLKAITSSVYANYVINCIKGMRV